MMFQSLAIILIIATSVTISSGNHRVKRSASCAKKFQQFDGHSACLPMSSDATSFELTSEEKEKLVDQHNELRAKVNPTAADMLKMSWDDEVAMIAQKWTDSCKVFEGGRLQHDKNPHRLIPGRFSVGQNLAMGYRSFGMAIDAWYMENEDYHYEQPPELITAMVGHYTQMVWAESYKLGCSKTKCGRSMIYACNYAPAGNSGGAKPYKTGASMCKKVSNGLCDCGSLECDNGSPLNVSTCSCKCTDKYYLDKDCKFNCTIKDKFYCGKGDFSESNCMNAMFSASISQQCPHMCSVCPYAQPGYKSSDKGSRSTPSTSTACRFLIGLLVPLVSMTLLA